MQNKGAIKLFSILFALVCLFTLSFTFFTKHVENKASKYAYSDKTRTEAKTLAHGDAVLEQYYFDSIAQAKESHYLDSVSDNVVFNFFWLKKYTYKDCKSKELGLGLDLKGGMNVMLEVSTVDVVRSMAGNTTDPLFNKAIERAIQKHQTNAADFVTLFGQAFKELDPNAQLAGYFNVELKDKIKLTSSNDEVLSVIRKETSAAFDRTYQIMRQRIDKFGVAQPNIQKLSQSERILVELPGVKDPKRVRKLLQGTAQLEFWETYSFSEIFKSIEAANTFLVAQKNTKEITDTIQGAADSTHTAVKDTSLLAKIEAGKKPDTSAASKKNVKAEEWMANNPLFSLLRPNVDEKTGEIGKGPIVGMAAAKDMAAINEMLEKAKKVLPQNLKLLWTAQPVVKGSSVYHLVAIKTTRDGKAPLEGDVVVDARQDMNQTGEVIVDMAMNADGARKWKQMTGANVGKSIAIVLDNYVYSFPSVNYEISGGRSQISGHFTVEEASDLANILKAGKLPAPAKIIQEAVVGPTLGQESINSGLNSFILAFLIIFIYILFFYSRSGLVANIALLINMFFLLGVLASIQAILTLPGIAGIVLTMAMAVDANVIIYERVKEELREGKGLHLAIAEGYKHAMRAIIDGNATTLIVGIILIAFGSGPVQGFAVTLTLGILTSFFTSVLITRLMFTWMEDKKMKIPFSTKLTENFLANTHIDFVGSRKYVYILSSILVLTTIGTLTFKGLNYGVDFTGGRTYTIRFDQNVKVADIRDELTKHFDGEAPEVKTFGNKDQVKITTKYLVENANPHLNVDSVIDRKLYQGCKIFYNKPITENSFLESANSMEKLGLLSKDRVEKNMSNDIQRTSWIAVLAALFAIFAYIAVRFKHWQYGAGAFFSLLHDALITIGMFSLFSGILPFSLEVDQHFIAAILTIIAYSINDTVIIFDRVREYRTLYPKRDLKSVMNDAMNSTLSRTVNTTGSMLLVLIMMFIFGGDVIRGFIFALLFGVFIGVYSSLFVACPIAYDFLVRKQKKAEALAAATNK